MARVDVLLVGAEWPERALLRAELIEAGYDVIAIDTWPIPHLYRQPHMEPRVAIVDLKGLPDPRTVLEELRLVVPLDRALVLTALGTLAIDDVRQFGCRIATRPISIRDVVRIVGEMLRTNGG